MSSLSFPSGIVERNKKDANIGLRVKTRNAHGDPLAADFRARWFPEREERLPLSLPLSPFLTSGRQLVGVNESASPVYCLLTPIYVECLGLMNFDKFL